MSHRSPDGIRLKSNAGTVSGSPSVRQRQENATEVDLMDKVWHLMVEVDGLKKP